MKDWSKAPIEWTRTNDMARAMGCNRVSLGYAEMKGHLERRIVRGQRQHEWRRKPAPMPDGVRAADNYTSEQLDAILAEKDERIAQLEEEAARLQAERDEAIQMQQRAEDGVTVSVLREEIERLKDYASRVEADAVRNRARVDALTDMLIEARR